MTVLRTKQSWLLASWLYSFACCLVLHFWNWTHSRLEEHFVLLVCWRSHERQLFSRQLHFFLSLPLFLLLLMSLCSWAPLCESFLKKLSHFKNKVVLTTLKTKPNSLVCRRILSEVIKIRSSVQGSLQSSSLNKHLLILVLPLYDVDMNISWSLRASLHCCCT